MATHLVPVEQLTRNEQVSGSSPLVGLLLSEGEKWSIGKIWRVTLDRVIVCCH
jgi:hypothetical protein